LVLLVGRGRAVGGANLIEGLRRSCCVGVDAIQEEIEQLDFDVRSRLCAIDEQLGAPGPE
jgi:hypothetical protein